MVGPVSPASPGTPERRGKDHDRQEEEDAGHLQPQDGADPAKGTQKTAHAAHNSPCRPTCLLPICLIRNDSAYSGIVDSGRWFRSPSSAGDLLAGHPSGDPQSDSEGAPDALRFHFVMMVAVPLAELLFPAYLRFAVAPGRRSK
jgi:hypothetical protein